MKKEQWKDKVMGSLEGIQRAKPSPDLFDKIISEIDTHEPKSIPKMNLAIIILGILLLLLLNLFAINQYRTNITPTDSENIENENVQYAFISDFKLYE